MKKLKITTVLFLISVTLFAQSKDSIITKSEFHSAVFNLTSKIKMLEKNNTEMLQKITVQKNQIDCMSEQLKNTRSEVQQIADSLKITISNVSLTKNQTQSQIQTISQSISSRTLYWIIGIIFLSLACAIVFFVLRNKLTSSTKSFDSQLAKTNETLQTEAIKLDSKLVEILLTQLSILKLEAKGVKSKEIDHKLPLKVGDEIHKMRKRIENMPQDIKGLNALTNSLQRLEEEFNDSGYEIEDLMGKKYVDGMKIEARFVDNPKIPKRDEIITDVLRPQIMYKGSVIQVAKVEVSKS
jgi:predicted nuclease with TOPRIM domain